MKTKLDVGLADMLKVAYGLLNPILDVPEDGLESNTFIVVDGKQKGIAKLYDDNLRAEIVARFQDRLHAAGVPVPAVLPATSGGLTAKLGDSNVVLCEFVYAKAIGWGKEFSSLSGPLTASIASVVANMHQVSQIANIDARLDHSLSVMQMVHRLESSLDMRLLSGNLAHARQAMIHGDLARENIFLTEHLSSVKAIIDFGDSHYDYITYDIATLLTQVYVTKSWGIDFQGIKDFLTSYKQLNTLRHDELKTILPLMELRNRGLIQGVDQRLKGYSTNRSTLESIKQSLGVKIQLLEKQGQQLENLILSV
jgi:Ser/Thr protein kinase RdoA (MazF antagonist)